MEASEPPIRVKFRIDRDLFYLDSFRTLAALDKTSTGLPATYLLSDLSGLWSGCTLDLDPVGTDEGLGMRIMKYRAALIGAKLVIASAESGGTRVHVRF